MPYPQLDPAKIRVRPLAERKSKSAIADILIDPEQPPKPAPQLQPLLAGLPPPEKIVLHYLNGKVEVELFLGHAFFENGEALRRAETTLAERLKMHTTVRSISLNCMIAPN